MYPNNDNELIIIFKTFLRISVCDIENIFIREYIQPSDSCDGVFSLFRSTSGFLPVLCIDTKPLHLIPESYLCFLTVPLAIN